MVQDHLHVNSELQYQLFVDFGPNSQQKQQNWPVRDKWVEAAEDAIVADMGKWIGSHKTSIWLRDHAQIKRIPRIRK